MSWLKAAFKNWTDKLEKRGLSFSSFFALAGFIFVLCLSWIYLSQPDLDEEERLHGLLQNQFQSAVADLVAKKRPETDEIVFHKVWTKRSSDPRQIEIFFSYSLLTEGEAGGELSIEGSALLEQSMDREAFWLVQNFQVTDSSLSFSEPLAIRASPLPPEL